MKERGSVSLKFYQCPVLPDDHCDVVPGCHGLCSVSATCHQSLRHAAVMTPVADESGAVVEEVETEVDDL